MCAMVACTASIGRSHRRIPAGGWHGARVIHALLFLVAQSVVLAPGVCDACVKGCCEYGMPLIADVASPVFHGVSASSAEAVGCEARPCCGTPATDRLSADHRTADACDADGTAPCRCQHGPRDVPPAASSDPRTDRRDDRSRWMTGGDAGDAASPPSALGLRDGMQPLAVPMHGWAAAIPTRPVRVLYGVWRN